MRHAIGALVLAGSVVYSSVAPAAAESELLLFDATGDFASRDCRIHLSVFSFFDSAHVERLEGRIVAVLRDGRRKTYRFSVADLWPKASALAKPVLEYRRTNCRAIEYLLIRSLDRCIIDGRQRKDCLDRSAGSESSSIPIRFPQEG